MTHIAAGNNLLQNGEWFYGFSISGLQPGTTATSSTLRILNSQGIFNTSFAVNIPWQNNSFVQRTTAAPHQMGTFGCFTLDNVRMTDPWTSTRPWLTGSPAAPSLLTGAPPGFVQPITSTARPYTVWWRFWPDITAAASAASTQTTFTVPAWDMNALWLAPPGNNNGTYVREPSNLPSNGGQPYLRVQLQINWAGVWQGVDLPRTWPGQVQVALPVNINTPTVQVRWAVSIGNAAFVVSPGTVLQVNQVTDELENLSPVQPMGGSIVSSLPLTMRWSQPTLSNAIVILANYGPVTAANQIAVSGAFSTSLDVTTIPTPATVGQTLTWAAASQNNQGQLGNFQTATASVWPNPPTISVVSYQDIVPGVMTPLTVQVVGATAYPVTVRLQIQENGFISQPFVATGPTTQTVMVASPSPSTMTVSALCDIGTYAQNWVSPPTTLPVTTPVGFGELTAEYVPEYDAIYLSQIPPAGTVNTIWSRDNNMFPVFNLDPSGGLVARLGQDETFSVLNVMPDGSVYVASAQICFSPPIALLDPDICADIDGCIQLTEFSLRRGVEVWANLPDFTPPVIERWEADPIEVVTMECNLEWGDSGSAVGLPHRARNSTLPNYHPFNWRTQSETVSWVDETASHVARITSWDICLFSGWDGIARLVAAPQVTSTRLGGPLFQHEASLERIMQ